MDTLQRENDELRMTLARKQLQSETLRTDLSTLESKFRALEIQKREVEERLEQTQSEYQSFRNQVSALPPTDPSALQAQIVKLQKSLESKTRDFDYLAAQYQETGAAAAERAGEVGVLTKELEGLRRRVEGDVRKVTWEGERQALIERVAELEERCRLLEERDRRIGNKEGDMSADA
jgi:capsule polysaccharide export protein KpsE/RkpR